MASLHFNPPVIAHRGASAHAPENTLIAFVKAAQLGIKWVEFDVMLAACGTAIIFHDDDLGRTTNHQGPAKQYSHAFLRTLDAGSWFDSRYAGERIPSLAETLLCLETLGLNANIELKSSLGEEEQLVKAVLAEIKQSQFDFAKLLFSSFCLETLQQIRFQAPTVSLGLLIDEWREDCFELCEQLQCETINLNQQIITQQRIQLATKKQLKSLAYTVNDVDRARQLFGWGLAAVFTDVPDRILNIT